jgi:hypothetical protein
LYEKEGDRTDWGSAITETEAVVMWAKECRWSRSGKRQWNALVENWGDVNISF